MPKPSLNEVFEQTSFLYGSNAPYVAELYARYVEDPESVDESWREFFAMLGDDKASVLMEAAHSAQGAAGVALPEGSELLAALDSRGPDGAATEGPVKIADLRAQIEAHVEPGAGSEQARTAIVDSVSALMLIRAYRVRGHLKANLDPLGLENGSTHQELDPANYGFSEADMDRQIYLHNVLGLETANLKRILEILNRTYCSTIGVQFMHITDPKQKQWIQERIEGPGKKVAFTPEGKRAILTKLVEAEGFEKFLGLKYTGTKRFGLDGAEALIPAMEQIIKRGGQLGVKEIVLGTPHRGRLNVLGNVMGKPYRAIFHEFKGGAVHPDDVEGSGDVKYHLGASSDREFDGNRVHLSLTANPSHLEAVNPVVLGKARAKQAQYGDKRRRTVLPLLLHGDAAFAGQGVVAECFGLSGLRGHRAGGTIHIIINNQIGFTTSPRFARSSPYPSDVALMVQAPIFHVNGDDPEAVVYVARIATEFRQKFAKDVVIDMFCYRRFGHNEGDEPAFTQPLMYKTIRSHPTTLKLYGERLAGEGLVAADEVQGEISAFQKRLETEFDVSDDYRPNKADWLDGRWSGIVVAQDDDRRGSTAVEPDRLRQVGKALTHAPGTFNLHRTLKRILANKEEMIRSGRNIDWATAEALAFGTLLLEGFPVRLAGQDSVRGTFSQRHAQFVDQETEKRYTPLNHIAKDQAEFEVIDSMLSEEAVLGFEYGYSLAEPNALVLWEAQFGDFANGAQVIIDQFIASAERKWLRMSGIVLLLPHGYEGQGPEHSSARLERFLQQCAEDNMQVANCTTPANYFHILRRQLHRNFRKPLILMTPKSLLRHKRCVSNLEDMAPGNSFHRVLWDQVECVKGASKLTLKPDAEISRVILCSGKVYFDLFEAREQLGIDDMQILRVEQLYPFPAKSLIKELSRFRQAEMVWCQEEPKNMGAWTFMEPSIEWVLNRIGAKSPRVRYVGRPGTASTATGLMSRHREQLQAFLDEAFARD